MDTRQALSNGSTLLLSGLRCTIQKEIGRGSNAIVYQASYPDLNCPEETHTVLIKELFPFHPHNAIYRAEDGAIVCTEEGADCWQQQRLSFEYGNRIHLRLLRAHPELTGENWNSIPYNNTLYTVLGYTGGRSLSEEMTAPETELRRLALRMQRLLDALESFHSEGYLHLDIAPDNILLIGRGRSERVMLIDYNSVHTVGQSDTRAERFSTKTGYTAPEIRTGHYAAVSEAADLYSVTAVFYRCLTGKALTVFQMSRPLPPDVSDYPALRDMPETVKVMVQQLLIRGLQNLPERRISSTQEMQTLFRELIDRIDGVGVTHAALWEAGQKTVLRSIRDNPALAYIQVDELFPSNVYTEGAPPAPTQSFIDRLMSVRSRHCFLTAPGGMGKTTALLRAVYLHTQRYSPREPALLYIPLMGSRPEEADYLTRRILENLRFKPETQNYEEARRHLRELLDCPLATREGERPVVLLLLDGLNEVSASTDALLRELRELAALRGVRILLTSRSGEAPEGFLPAVLSPLAAEDVTARLAEKGLLLPEAEEMRELLRTPLMLSLFLRASQAEEKQLPVRSAEDLIAAYFDSLVEKATRDLPEDAQARWQTEAAVQLVLPAIAYALKKKTQLSAEDLMKVVNDCYRLFSDRLLLKAFPRWLGHSRDIKGEAANADEWLGLIVHDVLWKRLGLLLYTEQDGVQIPHQILCEYLARRQEENLERLRRRRRRRRGLCAGLGTLVLALCFGLWFGLIREKPYDDDSVRSVLTMSLSAYMDAARQYTPIRELVTAATQAPESFSEAEENYAYSMEQLMLRGWHTSWTSYYSPDEILANALAQGTYVSWSGEALDAESYKTLLALPQRREVDYDAFARALCWVIPLRDNSPYRDYWEDYCRWLGDLLNCDAEITDRLMDQVYFPHAQGMANDKNFEKEYQNTRNALSHSKTVSLNSGGETRSIVEDDLRLSDLMHDRDELVDRLYASPAYVAYQKALENPA